MVSSTVCTEISKDGRTPSYRVSACLVCVGISDSDILRSFSSESEEENNVFISSEAAEGDVFKFIFGLIEWALTKEPLRVLESGTPMRIFEHVQQASRVWIPDDLRIE